jgi:hypothetical protein
VQRRVFGVAIGILLGLLSVNCGDNSTQPQPAAVFQISSGDLQGGIAGATLPAPLIVTVTKGGKPLRGAMVTFTPLSIGGVNSGTLDSTTVATDSQGIAKVWWTLSADTVDTQRVEVRRPGSVLGTTMVVGEFRALARSPGGGGTGGTQGGVGTATQFVASTAVSGNAMAGAFTTDTPLVRIMDKAGHGVSGLTVAWSTAAGSGDSVTSAITTTNAQGYASTHWKLGPAAGWHTLTATAAGFKNLTFSFYVFPPSPDNFNFIVQSPATGAVLGDSATVDVTFSSLYEIRSVTASIGTHRVALSYVRAPIINSPTTYVWLGSLPLSGVPIGPVQLLLTAKDALGDSAILAQTIIHDPGPVITVTSPADFSVAQPAVHLAATCVASDQSGCLSLTSTMDDKQIATGTSSIDATVSLSADEGFSTVISFTAKDRFGASSFVKRTVYVESNSHLVSVATVGGKALDIDSTGQILFVDRTTGVDVVKVHQNGSDVTLAPLPADDTIQTGALTAVGAVVAVHSASTGLPLLEIQSGTVTTLDAHVALWAASAHYVAWIDGNTLYRRDLVAGTTTVISPSVNASSLSIADDGSIVYAPSFRLFNNGWVAFDQPSVGASSQVWTISPTNDTVQVTEFGAGSSVSTTHNALGSGGEIVVAGTRGLYAGRPPYTTLTQVTDGYEGPVVWRGGQFYLILGTTVFRIAF